MAVRGVGKWPSWLILGASAVWLALMMGNVDWVRQARALPDLRLFIDFDKGYYPAGLAIRNGDMTALRGLLAGADFVNLPILGYLLVPFSALDSWNAALVFLFINAVAVVLGIVLTAWLAGFSYWPLIAALFVVNGPLMYSLQLGNSTQIVYCVLVGGCIAASRGHRFAAGLLFGLCALLKLPLLILGVLYLLRRDWSVVLGGATIIGLAGVASLLAFGWEINRDWYLLAVAPYLGHPIAAANVHSISAFLLRLETGPHALHSWSPRTLSSTSQILLGAIQFATLCVAGWLAVRYIRGRRSAPAINPTALEFLGLGMAISFALVFSTLTWMHYYMLLLLPWSLFLAGRLPLPRDRVTATLMGFSILVGSLPIDSTRFEDVEWIQEFASRTTLSAWLFAGLACLFALTRGFYRLTGGSARVQAAAPA